MNMQFSIATQLDVETLNRAIDTYYDHEYQGCHPYIFMNMNTLIQLSKQTEEFTPKNITKTLHKADNGESYMTRIGQTVVALYKGHKVYVDSDLKYGEVEIR